MEYIEAHFRISYLDGNTKAYYSNKKEFINDCEGIKNFEFSSEILKKGSVLKWQNEEIKVSEIQIEFGSILTDGNRIQDENDRILKTIIVVVIFIEN